MNTGVNPRGERMACSLRSIDGCVGSYDVFPGENHKSIARVEPVKWDKQPQKDVMEAAFSVIGEMGMTGHIVRLNQYQWRAIKQVKFEEPFYAAILWGGNPLKVADDAEMLAKRG